jgi:DNA alkylation damage repair protein AlkB
MQLASSRQPKEIYKVVDRRIKNTKSIEDLEDIVVDFRNIHESKSKFKQLFTELKINDKKKTNEAVNNTISRGLFPQIDSSTKAYIIDNDSNGRNGLIILPENLNTMQQIYWSYHSLTELCEPETSKSNLSSTNQSTKEDKFEKNLFKKFVENNMEDSMIIDKKMLDLKWTTHGYHFDWDNRLYQEHNKNEFPTSLHELSSHIMKSTFVGRGSGNDDVVFFPEACIVNFYSNKGRMGGHKDDVEPDQTTPVVSISLCNDAIFLIGGVNKYVEPIPIRLRSGDVMIMSGSSRRAVHGVSTILQRTIAPNLLNGLINYSLSHIINYNKDDYPSNERKEKLLDYFSVLRININVRQVFDRSRKTVTLKQRKTFLETHQKMFSLDLPARTLPLITTTIPRKKSKVTSIDDLPERNFDYGPSFSTPPIVFLDLDGVLNYSRTNSEIHLEKELVQQFRKLWEKIHFKIVLSTFWRGFKDYISYILSRKGFPADQIIGTTSLQGNHATNNASDTSRKRCDDILEYLEANPHIKRFVILDDRQSASNDILSQHFVHTSSNKGLTGKKANEAFKILNEKRWEYGKKKGNTKL